MKVHSADEAVESGLIRYSVVGTEWWDRVGEGSNMVTPGNRFLVVRLTAFNRSSEDLLIPPLTVIDDQGQPYSESSGMETEPQWLGLVRKIPGNDSRQGVAFFDVHPGRYKLRLMDSTGQDRHAMIELPIGIAQ